MAARIPASLTKRIPLAIALGVTLLFAFLMVDNIRLNNDRSFLTSLDLMWRDAKFRLRGPKPSSEEVVVVGIDDRTLEKMGSARTFDRKVWAKLVDRLREGRPKVVGFDIFFSEKERPAGCESDRVEECGGLSEGDRLFAEAVGRSDNVVLGIVLDLLHQTVETVQAEDKGAREKARAELRALGPIINSKNSFPSVGQGNTTERPDQFEDERRLSQRVTSTKLIRNIDELTRAATSFGFVNMDPDDQGRLRFQPQFIDFGGVLFPSLDVELVRRYLDENPPQVDLVQHSAEEDHFSKVSIGNRVIPLDEFGRIRVNYDGSRAQTVSMVDVLEGDKGALDALRGKIVLVGAAAVGLGDYVATPFEAKLPGVYLHANLIQSILRQNYLTRSQEAQFTDVLLIVVFGALLGVLLPGFNATRSVVYTILLFMAHVGLNVASFLWLQWELSFIYPGLALVSTSGSLIAYKYLTEERERKRTKSTFQFYLDPNVIERVMDQPDLLKLGGEKREMSVLFSDIRGFTSFSEKMTPDEVVTFLNQYFDQMTGLIMKKEGCLDKLIGDAVMCFWGAPLDIKDHAVRATICALEMLHKVEELRSVLTLPGGARFEIGIGVNTGSMVVGNMGSHARFAYTVMGDNVNLGSRLEAMNKYYGTKILISDATYNECKEAVYCRELDTIQVKGKSQAVTIYEPLGVRRTHDERRLTPDRRGPMTPVKQAIKALVFARQGDRRRGERRMISDHLFLTPQQEELALAYENALAYYRLGNFDVSDRAFDRVLQLSPNDGPARLMKARIAKYRSEHLAGETWDPVYKFDEK